MSTKLQYVVGDEVVFSRSTESNPFVPDRSDIIRLVDDGRERSYRVLSREIKHPLMMGVHITVYLEEIQ